MITEKLRRSKATEVDTVLQLIITAYKRKEWSHDSHLTGIFNEIIPLSEKLASAIKRLKTESDLEELDHIRDEAVRAFFGFVKGNIYNPNAAVKSAALAMMEVLDNFTLMIVDESYPVESSLVRVMLEQLNSDVITEKMGEFPGSEELLAEVADAEKVFDTAYYAFEQEKIEQKMEESATEIKRTAIKMINESLIVYLRALAMVNEAEYGELARTVGQVIEENNRRVKQRSAANKQ